MVEILAYRPAIVRRSYGMNLNGLGLKVGILVTKQIELSSFKLRFFQDPRTLTMTLTPTLSIVMKSSSQYSSVMRE